MDPERPEQNDSPYGFSHHLYKRGPFNVSPKTWTLTTLLFLFLLTLLAAHQLVASRAGRRKAQQNAAQLIEMISQKGLQSCLGHRPSLRYYIIEDVRSRPKGYLITFVQPIVRQRNTVFYGGGQILFSDGDRVESYFHIKDDLSRYSYLDVKEDIISHQRYRGDELLLSLKSPSSRTVPIPLPKEENIICPALLDTFSSLAARQPGFSDGAAFQYAEVVPIRGDLLHWIECHIRPADRADIPQAIVREFPDGTAVQATWSIIGRADIRQRVYYDDDHQIIWQEMLTGNATMRVTDKQTLLHHFPDDRDIIEQDYSLPDNLSDDFSGAGDDDYHNLRRTTL